MVFNDLRSRLPEVVVISPQSVSSFTNITVTITIPKVPSITTRTQRHTCKNGVRPKLYAADSVFDFLCSIPISREISWTRSIIKQSSRNAPYSSPLLAGLSMPPTPDHQRGDLDTAMAGCSSACWQVSRPSQIGCESRFLAKLR